MIEVGTGLTLGTGVHYLLLVYARWRDEQGAEHTLIGGGLTPLASVGHGTLN